MSPSMLAATPFCALPYVVPARAFCSTPMQRPLTKPGPCRRYDIFGKYGAIRQIRVGVNPVARHCTQCAILLPLTCRYLRLFSQDTKGTAFVVFEDIYDAKVVLPSFSASFSSDLCVVITHDGLFAVPVAECCGSSVGL